MPGKKQTPPGSTPLQAADLRRAVLEAYDRLRKAHVNYDQALAVAVDTELSSDGRLALKQNGLVYADTVTRYTNAVMAWLAFVEIHEEQAIQLLRAEARE